MKKIIKRYKFLVLCVIFVAFPRGGFGQLPVTDVSHITISTAGFIESVDATVKNAVELANQLAIMKKTYDELKAMKKVFDYANMYIQNVRAIEDITRGAINIAEMSTSIYKDAVNSRLYENYELAYLLSNMTGLVVESSQVMASAILLLDPDMWTLTQNDRKTRIDSARNAVQRVLYAMKTVKESWAQRTEARKIRKELISRGALGPAEVALLMRLGLSNGGVLITPDMRFRFIFGADGNVILPETETEAQSVTNLQGSFKYLYRLFMILSAFALLFGAFKVYQKVMVGEDIYRSLVTWVTILLTFLISMQIVSVLMS
jgi:ABC-type multidrug transport system fused ATPase/permease subunit